MFTSSVEPSTRYQVLLRDTKSSVGTQTKDSFEKGQLRQGIF